MLGPEAVTVNDSSLSKPELLAPAGDLQSLRAALQAGADAVYFGLDDGFNARARAENFSLHNLAQTVQTLHRGGAKAYLTLNTLLFEPELPILKAILQQAAAAGVDAIIVQDPAVALLARAMVPTLAVHASTQMTISSPEAAAFAEDLGCTRVVLPRELSLEEIRQFVEKSRIETEVFVHGALCVSWSGQCLTSEAWGGRSANRGQCAQSCRMPYDLLIDGEKRDLGDVRYLLSPLDLAALPDLTALTAMGVHGVKIEGRQKGPQYVSTAVSAYRRQLDAPNPQLIPSDLTSMALSYSRGFSPGFLRGCDHQHLVEGRFPKHRGLLLGVIAEVLGQRVRVVAGGRTGSGGLAIAEQNPETAEVFPTEPRNGQGVVIDAGRPEDPDEIGGPLYGVARTDDGWWLSFASSGPSLRGVAVGSRVWLSGDPHLGLAADKQVQATPPSGRIVVDLDVSGRPGQVLQARLSLTIRRGEPSQKHLVIEACTTTPLQAAQGQGLGAVVLRDKLGAMGNTPYCLGELRLDLGDTPLHGPVSELKALRRTLQAELDARLETAYAHRLNLLASWQDLVPRANDLQSYENKPQLRVLCRTDAQLEAVIDSGLGAVELDWMDLTGLTRAVDKAKAAGLGVTIATVRVQKPGEDCFDRRFARLQPDGVLVRHWGALQHFSQLPTEQRPEIHGDFSLNVCNSVTANHLLGLGLTTITAAHDLDATQLTALLEHVPAQRVVVTVQHHMATFHTEHCLFAHLLSTGKDYKTCGRPCEHHTLALRDHQGLAHPVVVDVGCRNTVFNAQAQSAAFAVPALLQRGVRQFRLEFVSESKEIAANVVGAWQALLAGEGSPQAAQAAASAHEQFGVTRGTMRVLRSLNVDAPA